MAPGIYIEIASLAFATLRPPRNDVVVKNNTLWLRSATTLHQAVILSVAKDLPNVILQSPAVASLRFIPFSMTAL